MHGSYSRKKMFDEQKVQDSCTGGGDDTLFNFPVPLQGEDEGGFHQQVLFHR